MENKSAQNSPAAATRREFLKKTATAAAVVAASPLLKPTVYGQAPSAGRVIGANDRINIGFIGVGAQGTNAHVNLLTGKAAENNIAAAAVCDVWGKRRDAAKKLIEGRMPGAKVDAYVEYEKLLERKDIDAVVIATHDPIHAAASIAALESGKHVYCEKPLTRYLEEAFAVEAVVKKTGKILQVGSQGTSAAGWHKAAELIDKGSIGSLVWGYGSYCRNKRNGEWNYPIDTEATDATVDFERWLGKVSKRGKFNAEHYFRWRKFFPYCAGLLGDLVPHRLLPLMLAMGKKSQFPARVTAIGTKSIHTDKTTPGALERDVAEHITVTAEFPNGATLVIVSSTVAEKSEPFSLYGHHATLTIGQAGEKVDLTPQREFADEIDPETFDGLKPVEDIAVHHKNWLDCIRTNQQPNCNIDLAVRAQTVISLAEMSDRLKVTCEFNETTRKITANGKEVKPLTYGTLELS